MEHLSSLLLILLNVLCLLIFLACLFYTSFARKTPFDAFQYTTMILYCILILCQTAEVMVAWKVVESYDDPKVQVFETVQTSLFFLLVDSIWYRLKALREGDRYLVDIMVRQARGKMLSEFLAFIVVYMVLTGMVMLTNFFERESQDPDKPI